MFKKNTEILEEKLFPVLRGKSGLIDADRRELINLCNYIDWALRSGLKLNFTLSQEELMLVEIAIES